METSYKKWYEVNYQKMVYGGIHTVNKKFYDLEEAYKCADDLNESFPRAMVWINECTLEKKEVK